MDAKRIFLRAFEMDDYILISEWRSDPDVTVLLSGNVIFVSSEREKKWVEDKIFDDTTSLYLAICLRENKEMIGYLSVNHIDLRNRKAEWAGLIIGRKDLWNKNYAKEATRLMLEHLFFQMNLHRIYAYVLEEHQASRRMMERSGFELEGILRDNIFKDNRYHNMAMYSLMKDGFETFIAREQEHG